MMRLALILIATISLTACAHSGLYEPIYDDGIYDAISRSDDAQEKEAL